MVYFVYLACLETKYLVPEGFTILRILAFPVKMKLFLLNKAYFLFNTSLPY